MHQTRETMPKEWPVARKGKKYVVVPQRKDGIPLLIVMRDMLKLGRTRKEIKKILNEGSIAVNGKAVKDERFSLLAFDIIAIKKLGKNYRVMLSKGKFSAEEAKDKDALRRISKVAGKKILGKGKIQLNLDNGYNILSNEKAKTGDSVILDLKEKKIAKVLPMEKRAKVFISIGKHKGEHGIIREIKERTAIIDIGNKGIEIQKENFIVIE